MFATSERVRPCRARCSPRSVGRVTTRSSPSRATVMSRWMRSESSPLGPLTVTSSGSIATLTPAGTGMGLRPIRLIADSPNLRHDLATEARSARLVTGHHAMGRRDDRRAHPTLDLRDVVMVDVGPLAGAGHPLDALDHRLAVARVLESHVDELAGVLCVGRLDLPALDVALLLEDAGQLLLELRGGDRHDLLRRVRTVAHAREEVGNRVGHRHEITRTTSSCRGCSRCARARAGRYGTARTF